MTPFEKLTGGANTVVLIAGIVAAVILSGADGVTGRAHGDRGTGDAPASPWVTSGGAGHDATHDRTGAPAMSGAPERSGPAAPDASDGAVATDPGLTAPAPRSAIGSRVPTTTSPTHVLDQLEEVLPAGDLDALTDLLDSLDPSVLDDVLDQLGEAIDTGTIEQLVDDLLGESDPPVPTTLAPLTITTVPMDDPTGAVDDVVEDPIGTLDEAVEDPTGTLDDTTESVVDTDTVTDAVDGLL